MGILIKSTQEKQIKIAGTDIDLTDIYGRVEFAGRIDGVTLDLSVYFFVNRLAFDNRQQLFTNVENNTFTVTLQTGEIQDLNTALNYSKVIFEQMGYLVDVLNN